MWPGSDIEFDHYPPTYLDEYDETVRPKFKINEVLNWLDMPIDKRPSLIATYMNDVDTEGHEYGPNSDQVF